MSRPDGQLLILGVGNVLLRDDAIGVYVARALANRAAELPEALPAGTEVIEGGTLGLALLPLIDDARAVLFVDAVDLATTPGRVVVLRGADLEPALGQRLSPHQVGTADLLAVAGFSGALPERAALVGIQPAAIEVGLELSDPVRRALLEAVDTAQAAAWELAAETAGVALHTLRDANRGEA